MPEESLRFIERNTRVQSSALKGAYGRCQGGLGERLAAQVIDFPVTVWLCPDRLEVESPGTLYGRRSLGEPMLPPAEVESGRGMFQGTLRNAVEAPAMDLLGFCAVLRSWKEIAEGLGLSTPAYAYRKRIQPLLASGKLRMTIPELPQGKKQEFVAV